MRAFHERSLKACWINERPSPGMAGRVSADPADGRLHGCSGRAGQFVGKHGLEGPGDPARPPLERTAIRCTGTASGYADPTPC